MTKLNGRPMAASQFLKGRKVRPLFRSSRGVLFQGDCLDILPSIVDECVDTVFADPPFNIGKEYGGNVNDKRADHEYVEWCRQWIMECARTLKEGGTFFLYNIPKWNIILSQYLSEAGLHFRDWIVIDIKFGLPIPSRLYPSHYSLLYFTKGKHKTFHKIRVPIQMCRFCGREVKDYGGHRGAINPKGVNLTDVWGDIPPVRHWKFKTKKRKANALSTKMLTRVIHMTTDKDDVILDPFGGSGTTYVVAEKMNRRWVGIEIESCDVIIDRIQSDDIQYHASTDVFED